VARVDEQHAGRAEGSDLVKRQFRPGSFAAEAELAMAISGVRGQDGDAAWALEFGPHLVAGVQVFRPVHVYRDPVPAGDPDVVVE
jgi:hypothetical protein